MFSWLLKLQERANAKTRKKWRLFYATDFESLMYSSFIFCHILGIFPYKISASTFAISKPRYIFSTIVICVLFIGLIIIFYIIDICGVINFQGVPRILERNCFYILSGFLIIVTYILSSPRMRLLQTIMEISSILPVESYQKLSRLIHTKDIFGFFLLLAEIPLYFNMNVPILFKIYLMYINLLIFHVDMLYMSCVCILKACFKRINDNLKHIRKFTMNDKSCHLPQMYYKQRNSFLLIKLKVMKKQHLIISNAVQTLNMVFSLQLLITITLTFAEITFHLYFIILYWQEGISMINVDNDSYEVYVLLSIIYYFIKIILIVWACETGKSQALQIGTTVHDVLNGTGDDVIKSELQLFSLQILHCGNIFSAKSLTVDARLLTSIMGNISTYLLILMQFLKMSHFCDRENALSLSPQILPK